MRARLATLVRRSPEEIALTRNTTEGLNIVIGGLRLAAGDEIVATTHEYPVTMNALRQRVAREGLQLPLVALPVAPDSPRAVVEAVRDNLSARTRLLVTPHVVDPTGQLLPIRALAEAARARRALYLVDGALGFGTVDVDLSEVDCDFYATSLHKGLHGPLGTGFLFVKQSQIQPLWPLLASPEPEGTDIRKLESVGTQPFAQIAALTQALDFHVAIGIGRLQARLHWLKRYWTDQVRSLPGIRFHTSLDEEQSAAIVLMEMERIEPRALYEHLLARDRIRAWPIVLPDVRGLWVAPFPYTLPHELDRLVSAIHRIVRPDWHDAAVEASSASSAPTRSAAGDAPWWHASNGRRS